MNERERQLVVGSDGLIAFGEYLNQLHETDYTFEREDADGRMVDCSLDDLIRCYKAFVDSDAERFKTAIGYNDYKAGTMVRTEREFRRMKKP